LKIGQYLTKLCAEHLGFTFLDHPVDEDEGVDADDVDEGKKVKMN